MQMSSKWAIPSNTELVEAVIVVKGGKVHGGANVPCISNVKFVILKTTL